MGAGGRGTVIVVEMEEEGRVRGSEEERESGVKREERRGKKDGDPREAGSAKGSQPEIKLLLVIS